MQRPRSVIHVPHKYDWSDRRLTKTKQCGNMTSINFMTQQIIWCHDHFVNFYFKIIKIPWGRLRPKHVGIYYFLMAFPGCVLFILHLKIIDLAISAITLQWTYHKQTWRTWIGLMQKLSELNDVYKIVIKHFSALQ